MTCYFCKETISKAHRTLVPARNNREKTKFRDLCDSCYREFWESQGYVLEEPKEPGGIACLRKVGS